MKISKTFLVLSILIAFCIQSTLCIKGTLDRKTHQVVTPGTTTVVTPGGAASVPGKTVETPKEGDTLYVDPKTTAKVDVVDDAKEDGALWKELFAQPRGEKCLGSRLIGLTLTTIDDEFATGSKSGRGAFAWLKNWGFGQVAFFFDFLDPVLRPLIFKDMTEIFKTFKDYPLTDANYTDPFAFNSEPPKSLDEVSKKRWVDDMVKRKAKVDTKVYENSINAVQAHIGLKENKWVEDGDSDTAKAFVKSYDLNQDGRLSPRELILGSILHNKNILGDDVCKICYNSLTDKIDGIFDYVDCDSDGLVSSEDLWKNIGFLRRETKKWNFLALGKNGADIRTAVTNDFILKNQNSIKGLVNKSEFRLGVLLGFWDRQTDDEAIFEDERKNLKALRWESEDVDDKGAKEYIARKLAAEKAASDKAFAEKLKANQQKLTKDMLKAAKINK